MASCPACGEENPDKFRLCGFCGTFILRASSEGSGMEGLRPVKRLGLRQVLSLGADAAPRANSSSTPA